MFKPMRQRDTDWPKKSRTTVIRESIKNKLGTDQDDYHDVFDNEIPFKYKKNHF
jgi:hypothetical protein